MNIPEEQPQRLTPTTVDGSDSPLVTRYILAYLG